MTDERDLLKAFTQTHSEEAFSALSEKHSGWVYNLCLQKLKNRDLAEEATQAVFIVLSKKASSLSLDQPLSGWLYRTAQFTVARMKRAETRKHKLETSARQLSRQSVTEESKELGGQTFELLDEALQSLRDHERQAILLRFYENKTHLETGNALGISEAAAEKRVNRSIQRLQSYFCQREVVLSIAGMVHLLAASSSLLAPPGISESVVRAVANKSDCGAHDIAKGVIKKMFWSQLKPVLIASVLICVGLTGAFGVFGADSGQPAKSVTEQNTKENKEEKRAALAPSVKDGLSVIVKATKESFRADEVLLFDVTFKNESDHDLVLDGVAPGCFGRKPKLIFSNNVTKELWQAGFKKGQVPKGYPPTFKLESGKSFDVRVKVGANDMEFTDQSGRAVNQLQPGKYGFKMQISLSHHAADNPEKPGAAWSELALETDALEIEIK